MKKEKPPIGVIPQTIWKELRLEELIEAFEKYVNVKKEIPKKWIEEYNELILEFKKEHDKYMVWDNLFAILASEFKTTKSRDMYLDGQKLYDRLSKKYLLIELKLGSHKTQ